MLEHKQDTQSTEVCPTLGDCLTFSEGTNIHCFYILRNVCSLLVSIAFIGLYTQTICASSVQVCNEVSTLHNQIILELSNWKRVIMCRAINVSWLISSAVI